MALPYDGSDWQAVMPQVLACYRDVITTLLTEDAFIRVLLLMKADDQSQQWLDDLHLSKDQRHRLLVMEGIDYNDTWTRDYGPLTLVCGDATQYHTFEFNGWGNKYPADRDTRVAEQMAVYLGQPVVAHHLVLEGGALEVNNQGVLLANSDCIVDRERNGTMAREDIEQALIRTLGISRVEWVGGIALTGDDTDGHIDTIARFVADDLVVACGRDDQHPDGPALRALNEQLDEICRRNAWQLLTLPVPQVKSVTDGRLLPATYANFLVCNQCLLLPVYGVPEDAMALNVLSKHLPHYRVLPINCSALVEQHGSLHCATMQLG